MKQRPKLAVAPEYDMTTLAAIPSIGSALGHKFLSSQMSRTFTPSARPAKDFYIIYKIRFHLNL
jgi:hypothetical protein